MIWLLSGVRRLCHLLFSGVAGVVICTTPRTLLLFILEIET
jgi:hypothetical protein